MSEWPEVTLGDLCHIARGGSPRPIKSFLTDTADGINWIKIGDATAGDGKYIASTQEKIRPEGLKMSRLVEPGDFLLSNSMSFGRPYIMRTTGCIHDGWLVLRDKSHRFDPDYLYYFLGSDLAFRQFDALAAGSTVRNLNTDLVKTVKVILPPLEEQRRIVAVLDEAFAAIAIATANAEKNLANARALFDATARTAFEANLTSGSFKNVIVEALADPRKGSMRTGPFGSQLLHSEFVDDGIAVLGIDNAVENEFRWGKRRFITEDKFKDLSRFLVHPGDVIITIMGTCGRCAVIPDDIPMAINSKHLFCISLDQSRCLPAYLHAYFLHAPDARAYLEERAQGSIMAGLNMGIIREMPIRLPSLEAQRRVVEAIDAAKISADKLTEFYQKKLNLLGILRQSLLHRAFTGELTATMPKTIAA